VTGLYLARPVLVPVVSALVLGLLFGPAHGRLVRLGLPGWTGAVLIVALFVSAIVAMVYALIVPFEQWANRLPEVWAELRYQLDGLKRMLLRIQDVQETVKETAGLEGDAETVVVETPGFLADLAVSAPVAAAQLIVFLGTLYFYLAGRDELRTQCLGFCATRHVRLQAARIFRDVEYAISNYLGTILLINIGLGIATFLVLLLVGFPNPVLFGALAAVLNFAPYLGPLVLSVLLVGVGLITYDTLWSAVLPAMFFFGLNVVEANVVTPSIVGRTFTIQPLAVFVSLAFWAWLWGFVGALLAVPMLLIFQVVLLRLAAPVNTRKPAGPR
jgi:predicted PurR-regulated permease PerM